MANPFKPDDKVLTHRKGIEIQATVRTTWNHEVQVRTADGDLLWRTVKTVRSLPAPATNLPADTPQNPESHAEVTQAQPPEVVQMQGAPATVEPGTVEPGTVEPDTGEPGACETTNQAVDQPAEPESQLPAKGTPKPKKQRKGILRKLMFDDSFDG